MGIKTTEFGKTKDGKIVNLYTLTNKNGVSASFIDLGGTWVSMMVPDKDGKFEDVCLGYDTVAGYENNIPHFGSIIGRYANRIPEGKFTIDGKEFQLALNNGNNALHSGPDYWHDRIWEVGTFEDEDRDMISFMLISPDGDQGFGGEARVNVSYVLSDDNALTIGYSFVCDKKTAVNLTNHAYFNLAGQDSKNIYDQEVMILADSFLPCDENSVPTGEIRKVENTAMDFRKYKKIGKEIDSDYDAVVQGGGYDHNWVIKDYNGELRLAAKAKDENSKRVMEVYTDLPGVQFYTGNYLTEEIVGKRGVTYPKRSGYCFETQFFPNAINMPEFIQPVVDELEEFISETVYKFSVERD